MLTICRRIAKRMMAQTAFIVNYRNWPYISGNGRDLESRPILSHDGENRPVMGNFERNAGAKGTEGRETQRDCAQGSKREVGVMPVRLDSAARYLCEKSGWSLSNLKLQKLLYLAQVEHASQNNGERLIAEPFQAWDYGPVVPRLYQKLKMFGAGPVENVFYSAKSIRSESPSDRSLANTWDQFGDADPGKLIEVSHWERGGWAARYQPGIKDEIRHADIVTEAENRERFADDWKRVVATRLEYELERAFKRADNSKFIACFAISTTQ